MTLSSGPSGTISIEVHDSYSGQPVPRLPVRFEQRDRGGWSQVGSEETDAQGRVADWSAPEPAGLYRCVLHTEPYFTTLGLTTSYPEIVVTLRHDGLRRGVRVTVLIASYAYLVHDTYE